MDDKKLIRIALSAAENAYAPYSDFKVGAAVLLQDGSVVTGNNQENASYPLCMCAERVAINYAKAVCPESVIDTVAVASLSTSEMITPCGACRQVMVEAAQRQGCDFDVVMADGDGVKKMKASELLPMAFKL